MGHADPNRVKTRQDLARELTALREHVGLTIRDLAKRVNTPSGTLGDYFSGRHVPSPAQLPTFRALLRECGVSAEEVETWVTALGRARAASDGRTARQAPPYRGLEPYRVEDAELFFGREPVVRFVLDRVAALREDAGPSGGVLAVVGPSGSGKSSLLRAGVVPAVLAGALDTADVRWRCDVTTPTAGALALPPGRDDGVRDLLVIDQFEEIFTSIPNPDVRRAYVSSVGRLARHGALVVLAMRADFYAEAAREHGLLPVLQEAQVLVGPMSQDELRRAIVEPARRVGAVVDDGLVDVVLAELAPHDAAGVAHDAGALPLMSHALLSTWERATRNHLTVADYRDSGGIEGAIQQTAEELYKSLTAPEQEVTRRLFLRMVNVDDEMSATRRRVSNQELAELSADLGEEASAESVLAQFVARRLITTHADTVEMSHEALLAAWPRLREWLDADRAGLRLHRQLTHATNAWQEGARDEGLLLRGGRLDAVAEWVADPTHRADLNRLERDFVEASTAAAQAERSAARRRTHRLQRLLAATVVLALAAAVLAAYSLHARSAANEERNAANRARDEALSRQVAIEADRLGDTDPALAEQLALAAYRISPTPDARSVLLDTSAQPAVTRILGPSGPTTVAMTDDGRLLAVSHADDGSVHLYARGSSGRFTPISTIPGDAKGAKDAAAAQLFALAFSPDGTLLAAGGAAQHVQLWDVSATRHPTRVAADLGGFGNAVQALVFSPDGATLAAAGTGPAIRMWDVRVRDRFRALATPAGMPKDLTAQTVAFGPDGGTLAVGGSDGVVRLWPTDALRHAPSTLAAGSSTIDGVAFSPDGRLLVAGSKDGSLKLWRLTPGNAPQSMPAPDTGFTSWVNAVAFSPDGRSLAAGSADNTLAVWDTTTWSHTATMPHPGPVTAIQFGADGRQLVSADADGTVRVWPTTTGIPVNGSVFTVSYSADGRRLDVATTGDRGTVALWNANDPHDITRVMPDLHPPADFGPLDGTSAITADGKTLATGNAAGRLLLWDVTQPARPVALGAVLTGPTALIESIAFSPDQRLLAAGSDDNKAYVWNVADPRHPQALAPLTGAKSIVLFVTFSADSRLLAAASADNTVQLYDVRDAAHIRQVATIRGFKNYAWSTAFSPDGRTLAVGSADHTIRLFDISDPRHPKSLGRPLTGPSNYVTAVAFTRDGRTLAAASNDNSVWLYDVADLRHPRAIATLRASAGPIYAMTFSPDGRTLAGGGGDSVVRLWDIDPARAAGRVCAVEGDPITRAEWKEYVPGASYRRLCA